MILLHGRGRMKKKEKDCQLVPLKKIIRFFMRFRGTKNIAMPLNEKWFIFFAIKFVCIKN